jgi:hypothetical protein
MENFDQLIGSGGFGLVVGHNKEDLAAKFLYGNACEDAKLEYQKQDDIYDAFLLAGKLANFPKQ